MSETAPRAMSPHDLTRIHFVSDPQISRDGRRVAFVVTVLSEEKDEYLSNIWIVDGTGGGPRRLTTGPLRDTAPRWSPDGTHLAFLAERKLKEKALLYVMPAEDGEAIRITDFKNWVFAPAWSPDGTHLVFVSWVGGWQGPRARTRSRSRDRPESSRH